MRPNLKRSSVRLPRRGSLRPSLEQRRAPVILRLLVRALRVQKLQHRPRRALAEISHPAMHEAVVVRREPAGVDFGSS
eukprot:30524-Pelagococcus_subviridis.AAC.3